MPQLKSRTEGKKMQTSLQVPRIESAKAELAKRALPFFGGTAPEVPAEGATKTEEPADKKTETPGGNGSADPKTEPLTPEAIAALVAKNVELDNALKEKDSKLEAYTKAEQEAADAKLSKEDKAQKDLAERDQTIQQMDKVIRTLAVENAIAQSKDLKFHSTKHVINELDPTEYEIDVDLKTGVATVSNLDKALVRISEANPWMVVDAAKDNPGNGSATKTGNQNPGGAKRGSGNPPNPGNSRSSDATQRRSELIKKFPVLAGRAK